MNPEDDVLVCEFDRRPRGAASLFDVGASIRQVNREPGALVIEFDPKAGTTVLQCTEAERLCCPTISWDIEDGPPLNLRIRTTPGRLQTLEEMFRAARSIA